MEVRDWRKRAAIRVRVSRAEDLEDLKPVERRIWATASLVRLWENSEGERVGFWGLEFDIWGFDGGDDWIIVGVF